MDEALSTGPSMTKNRSASQLSCAQAVSQHLGHDPAGLSRLYLILHWASPSDSKAAGADEASETKAAKVQVKQRGLVHLAAFHAALSGNPAVLELLLDKGADPRQACPDGDAFRVSSSAKRI